MPNPEANGATPGACAEPGAGGDGLAPDWRPHPRIRAWMTTRTGGVSTAPFDSLDVGDAVGDHAWAVRENRRRVEARCGVPLLWLRQVHGAVVVNAAEEAAAAARRRSGVSIAGPGDTPHADGAWTDRPGIACAVQVADCLPVLFAAGDGGAVGAAHAGWRGLAAGVLERTLAAVARAAGCTAEDVDAWLGPCIAPGDFEVGDEVRRAFVDGSSSGGGSSTKVTRFEPSRRADGSAAWHADLSGLACDRLRAAGVRRIAGGELTVADAARFFSFRRERITGRMVAAVWLAD